MTHDQSNFILETIVRRLGRSLLQYVNETYPWVTAQDQGAIAEIKKLAAEERKVASDLSEFLVKRRHTVAYLGAFPTTFTSGNFTALENLLPKLAAFDRNVVSALDRDLATLQDPEAREKLRAIIDMKQRQLQAIEALAANHVKPTATLR